MALGLVPSMYPNGFNLTAQGSRDGSIELTVLGGIPPYTYSWNGGQFVTEDLDSLPAGRYECEITDSIGCMATAFLFLVEPSVFDTINVSICEGDSFLAGGDFQYTTGLYYDTTTVPTGGYDILVTDLFVQPLSFITLDITICEGEVFVVGSSSIQQMELIMILCQQTDVIVLSLQI